MDKALLPSLAVPPLILRHLSSEGFQSTPAQDHEYFCPSQLSMDHLIGEGAWSRENRA